MWDIKKFKLPRFECRWANKENYLHYSPAKFGFLLGLCSPMFLFNISLLKEVLDTYFNESPYFKYTDYPQHFDYGDEYPSHCVNKHLNKKDDFKR